MIKIDFSITLLKDKEFLLYRTGEGSRSFRGMAAHIYLPTSDLTKWFEPKPGVKFLSLDEYRQMVDGKDHPRLQEFLDRLGVRKSPAILSVPLEFLSPAESLTNQRIDWRGRNHKLVDKYLDGCQEIISAIDVTRSVMLWDTLAKCEPLKSLRGQHTWVYNGARNESFKSAEELRLLKAKWILTKSGELVSPDAVTIQSISDRYDKVSEGAKELIAFLGIRDEADDTAHLSESEVRKIKLADELAQSGLSEDEIRTAIADAKRKKNVALRPKQGGGEKPIQTESKLIREIESRRPSKRNWSSTSQPVTPSAEVSPQLWAT